MYTNLASLRQTISPFLAKVLQTPLSGKDGNLAPQYALQPVRNRVSPVRGGKRR